ncbi:uncharacterized protein LY79DRAFT_307657 [Colletotrichum navitas]|uniref:Uncharacterized protein n=1 Tax=Colletotrichum navitas TaxID=681940 RepID=A0AAD8V1Z2_9PEZI|nr:uncharacterized protein LY79DRAFT_307657 [Colletotrichum navitas]KAK1580446.1 hypothetical protein LY79DRAFT_307657 [Colletotrichum navitas]
MAGEEKKNHQEKKIGVGKGERRETRTRTSRLQVTGYTATQRITTQCNVECEGKMRGSRTTTNLVWSTGRWGFEFAKSPAFEFESLVSAEKHEPICPKPRVHVRASLPIHLIGKMVLFPLFRNPQSQETCLPARIHSLYPLGECYRRQNPGCFPTLH